MGYRNREEEKLERREEQARRDEGGGTGAKGSGTGDSGRGKKTFAERDKARRGGQRERDDNERPRGKGESQAYRSYKSKLDRLFDGEIKLPQATVVEVVRKEEPAKKADAAPPSPVAAEPLSPKEQLKAAETPDAIAAATRACLAAGGLPNDTELLGKVLLLTDEALFLAGLEALLDAMERGRPKNAKVIVARIAERQPSLTDAHAIELASGIRARLGG